MKRIAKSDWDRVHEIAVEIATASSQEDGVLVTARIEELRRVLKELEAKYGVCSRIAATIADYAPEEERERLYREALVLAKREGDVENERLILESLAELSE
jgi:hypothetical protein